MPFPTPGPSRSCRRPTSPRTRAARRERGAAMIRVERQTSVRPADPRAPNRRSRPRTSKPGRPRPRSERARSARRARSGRRRRRGTRGTSPTGARPGARQRQPRPLRSDRSVRNRRHQAATRPAPAHPVRSLPQDRHFQGASVGPPIGAGLWFRQGPDFRSLTGWRRKSGLSRAVSAPKRLGGRSTST